MKLIRIALMSSLMSIGACTLLGTNTTVQLAVQAAIDAAVGAVFAATGPADVAAIGAAATTLKGIATGSTTSIATFEADADKAIAVLPLNVAEKEALEEIVTLAASAIATGTAKLSPTTSFDLGLVFGDIANAANLFTVTRAKAKALKGTVTTTQGRCVILSHDTATCLAFSQ